MRIKKILSIDFDYFIHYASHRSAHFCPESGIEFPRDMSNVIWGTKYAGALAAGVDMEELLSIRAADLEFLKSIILSQELSKTMVCDSHAHMIDFADSLYNPDTRFQIYNVDAHHDAYPVESEDDIHCGNWLTALLADGTAEKGYWISPLDEPYSTASPERCDPQVDASLQLSDLSKEGPFDTIFLCQSSSWVPPHLDSEFLELARMLIPPHGGYPCKLQQGILETRYNEEFLRDVATMAAFFPNNNLRRRK